MFRSSPVPSSNATRSVNVPPTSMLTLNRAKAPPNLPSEVGTDKTLPQTSYEPGEHMERSSKPSLRLNQK